MTVVVMLLSPAVPMHLALPWVTGGGGGAVDGVELIRYPLGLEVTLI